MPLSPLAAGDGFGSLGLGACRDPEKMQHSYPRVDTFRV